MLVPLNLVLVFSASHMRGGLFKELVVAVIAHVISPHIQWTIRLNTLGLFQMIRKKRKGFSLIEMVIVILILGIIAAVAAPRMFDTAGQAERNTTRQQLAVLRNAIEMFRAQTGSYPANGQLPTAMATMLNGPFPSPTVGSASGDSAVYYDTNTDTSIPVAADSTQAGGWAYKPANGSLKLNVASGEEGFAW